METMQNLLRGIVAGPRNIQAETNLDLCYVTDEIVATSGPSSTYPQRAYRNPTDQLVKFLDSRHGDKWAIWEFCAEGTDYQDGEVYGRIHHHPWPDHQPPPFQLVPKIVAEMKRWVDGIEGRVIVVHCKAGKGRSGTMACAFLISERGWAREDAQQRFTARRMRPACGEGVSMPSQVRCLEYTDRWTKGGKLYTERRCRVKEVRLWGLQKGVKVSIKGFDEGGRIVRDYHVFTAEEERVVQDTSGDPHGNLGPVGRPSAAAEQLLQDGNPSGQTPKSPTLTILRPSSPIELPTSDICLLMQSSITPYGISMVTSVAHAWFNIFLEGHGPEQNCRASDEGIFEIGWQSMDGVSSGSYCGLACMEKAVVGWEAGSGLTAASMEEGANTTTSMS